MQTAIRISVVGFVGIIFLSASFLHRSIFPHHETNIISNRKHRIPLNTSMDTYVQFHFFSLKNAEEYLNYHASPFVQHLGPYTFQLRLLKYNFTFNEDDTKVSYLVKNWFHFLPEISSGELNDEITIPNVPMIEFLEYISTWNIFQRLLVSNVMRMFKEKPYLNSTVEELLFKGRYYSVLKYLSEKLGREILPDSRFAFYYKENGTDRFYIIKTGNEKLFQIGNFVALENTINQRGFLNSTFYGKFNCRITDVTEFDIQTDGSQFMPPITKHSRLHLLIPELCRSYILKYQTDTSVEDIRTLRFIVSEDNFPSLEKDLRDFNEILKFSKEFNLKTPDKEDHETFFDIEPFTGVTLRSVIRFQYKLEMKPIPRMRFAITMPLQDYPVLWIDRVTKLKQEAAEQLKYLLLHPEKKYLSYEWLFQDSEKYI